MALVYALSLVLVGCDTIFPEREGFDAGTTSSGGNGGGSGTPDEQVYGYRPDCNCIQGFSCNDVRGCGQYTCFASGGTWREARDNCARQSQHLLVPADEDEADFVVDLCTDGDSPAETWWIGAQDILAEGTFTTETDLSFEFTPWAEGEPAADEARDCVFMGADGVWRTAPCNEKRAYVCAAPASTVPVRSVGSSCARFGAVDDCGAAQRCYEADAKAGVGVCTYPCASQDECETGARCTTTPAGRLCLKRCDEAWECAADNANLRCIPVDSSGLGEGGSGVCWTQGARSGEVQTAPDIVLDHIEFETTSEGGWPRPGERSVLHVFVRNDGDGDLFDARGTVSPIGDELYVEDLIDETGALVPVILAAGEPVEIATPTVELSPDLPLGTPARFRLTVNAEDLANGWTIDFGVTAYPSAALPWVTEVEASGPLSPGGEATVTLYAENLGFAAVSDVTSEVAVAEGDATWTPAESVMASLQDPALNPNFAPQRVAVGTLAVAATHTAGAPVLLDATLREPGGTVWTQQVAVPVD